MGDLQRRLLKLESGDASGTEPRLITIRGGLSDGPLLHASVGRHHRLHARPEESEDEFRDRCLDLAGALGEAWVIVGGLPDDPTEEDFPGC